MSTVTIILIILLTTAPCAVAKIIGRGIPIQLEYSNQNMFSSYIFNITFQTPIAGLAYLFIEFPSQYYNYLSLSPMSDAYLNGISKLPFTVKSNCIILELPGIEAPSKVYTIELMRILNPVCAGGTGQFKLYTKRYIDSVTEVEYNDIFGSVAFAYNPNIDYKKTYAGIITATPTTLALQSMMTIVIDMGQISYNDAYTDSFRLVFEEAYTEILDVDYSCSLKQLGSASYQSIICYGSSLYNAIYIPEMKSQIANPTIKMDKIKITKQIKNPSTMQASRVDIIILEVFAPNSTILINAFPLDAPLNYYNMANDMNVLLTTHEKILACTMGKLVNPSCTMPSSGHYHASLQITLKSLDTRYIVVGTPFSFSYCSFISGVANYKNQISSCQIDSSNTIILDGFIPIANDIRIYIEFSTPPAIDNEKIEAVGYLDCSKNYISGYFESPVSIMDCDDTTVCGYEIITVGSSSVEFSLSNSSSISNISLLNGANCTVDPNICPLTVRQYTCPTIVVIYDTGAPPMSMIICVEPNPNSDPITINIGKYICQDILMIDWTLPATFPNSSKLYSQSSSYSNLLLTGGAYIVIDLDVQAKLTNPSLTSKLNEVPQVDCHMVPMGAQDILCYAIDNNNKRILITNFASLPAGNICIYLNINGATTISNFVIGNFLSGDYSGKYTNAYVTPFFILSIDPVPDYQTTFALEPAKTNTLATATFIIDGSYSNSYCLQFAPLISQPPIIDEQSWVGYMNNLHNGTAAITCNTVLGTNVPCLAFPQNSIIYVPSISSVATKVIVNNILTPSSMYPTTADYAFFPCPLASISITTKNNYAMYPFAVYDVSFTIQENSNANNLGIGSSVHISLSREFFPFVRPAVVDFYYPECSITITGDDDVICQFDRKSNEFIISRFASLSISQPYTVELRGINNPNKNGEIGNFEISIYDPYALLSYRSQNITGPVLRGKKQPGEIKLYDHKMDPAVIEFNNTHYFLFTTQNSIPRKAAITIKYPISSVKISNLQAMTCKVSLSGKIVEIFKCMALNNTVSIIVNELISQDSFPKPIISVSVYPIYTTSNENYKTDLIDLSIAYNTLSIDMLYDSSTFFEILYNTAYIDNFQIAPQVINSGDESWYTFSFFSSASIQLKNCLYEITFPNSYPKTLGKSINGEEYYYASTEERKLIVAPLRLHKQAIRFNIYGIYNPNVNQFNPIDPFTLIVRCDGVPIERSKAYIQTKFMNPPAPFNYDYVTGLSNICTHSANLVLSFTQGNSLALLPHFYLAPSLSYKGTMPLIAIHDDVQSISLTNALAYDAQATKLFYSDPKAKPIGSATMFTDTKYMPLQNAPIQVGIRNTEIRYTGGYSYIPPILKFYNSTGKIYSVSTYPNLNTIMQSQCSVETQVIKVNSGIDSFKVPKGYSSEQITVEVVEGAKSSFSLIFSIPINGFTIEPRMVSFNIGDKSKSFIVLASPYLPSANYLLNISIQSKDTSLYSIQPSHVYANLHYTEKLYQISTSFDGVVTQGSCSTMIKVKSSIRPYIPLFILIKQKSQYPTGLTINPNLLEINSSNDEIAFKLCVSSESQGQKGKLSFSLRNPGFNSFYSIEDMSFTVEKGEILNPSINLLISNKIGTHSLEFILNLPYSYDIYYCIYEYSEGVSSLSSKELIAGKLNPPNLYKHHQFGKYVNPGSLEITITLSGLRSNKNHMFSTIVVDTNNQYSDISSIIAKTTNDEFPIKVDLSFSESMSQYMLIDVAKQIAHIVGVNEKRIMPYCLLSNKYDYMDSNAAFVVLPHKSDDTSNQDVANSILGSISLLKKYVTLLDDTIPGQSSVWYPSFPKFKQLPTIKYSNCQFGYVKVEDIKLSRPGIVHAIAVPLSSMPLIQGTKRIILTEPEEIVEGVNSNFESIKHSFAIYVSDVVNVEFSGLSCNETYAIELVGTDGLEENGLYPYKDSVVLLAYRLSNM